MEHKNCLGIYIANDTATGVLVSGHTQKPSILGTASVNLPETEDENAQPYDLLMAELSKALSKKNLKFEASSAAVDCSMYTQHTIRSEFKEHRQIANTIRFDAEEAVATDATKLAVTFSVVAADAIGSYVSTFTSDRHRMNALLSACMSAGMDPTAIESDIATLARFFERNFRDENENVDEALYVMLTESACYIIKPKSEFEPSTRSFLITPSQDKTAVLRREIPITLASLNEAADVKKIYLADTTSSVQTDEIATSLDAQVVSVDATQATGASADDTLDPAALAFAWGAAVGELTHTHRTDFREDFMPYQGRKRAIRMCLRTMSVAATIVLLAIGGYLHLQLKTANHQVKGVNQKLVNEYRGAMRGKTPVGTLPLVQKLISEKNKLKNQKTGITVGDEGSLAAKLTFILSALNDPELKNVDFEIEQISITNSNMTLRGNTPSKIHSLKVYNAIKKNDHLEPGTNRSARNGNRDSFMITMELK